MDQNRFFIRVFNAAPDTEPLNVSINNRSFASELAYGAYTNYGSISGGFITVTLAGSRTRRIYLQKTLPVFLPVRYTLAIIQTSNGIDIRQVFDYNCPFSLGQSACLRIANLSYESTPFDFYLYGNQLVFTDVSFKEVTPYKPFRAGEYGFYLETASQNNQGPLLSLILNLEAGKSYTSYIIGSLWEGEILTMVTLEYDDTIPEIQPR